MRGGGQRLSRLGATVGVVLLLALIWAVVLVPAAARAHAERKEAFLLSFGPAPDRPAPSAGRRSPAVQRRRWIAGGLVVAMTLTLLLGLLPAFRVLLVVHLFLLDSFIAYIGLLAHMAGRAAHSPRRAPAPARHWRGDPVAVPGLLSELGAAFPGVTSP